MLFSVIYEADVGMDQRIGPMWPPERGLWVLTECSDGEPNEWNGEWPCKHRKWCAVLTKGQFEQFLAKVGLVAEDVETMGSIGAPGCGYGRSPAMSFTNFGVRRLLDSYVTPLPCVHRVEDMETARGGFTEHDWERVRRAVLAMYGQYA